MTTAVSAPAVAATSISRRLPPVAELAVASIACMMTGGIYLASSLPKTPPILPAAVAVAAGASLTLVAVLLLVRIRPFAWRRFSQVLRWGLLAYGLIAGIIEYVFVYDHTRGATLVVMTAALAIFALDVPSILAFTVARFEDPER